MSNRRKTRSSAKTADPDPVTPPHVNPRTVATATTTPLSLLSLKSVLLHDWWLAPAPGKGLAIGGFESRGRQGVRVFRSAAIAIRHSATILETTDGVRITISGFINRARTHQNGFPLKVCSHFLIGFPYYWEKYAARNHNGESADGGSPGVFRLNLSGSNMGSFPPGSLSNQPAARIHDAIMFSQGGSGSHNLIQTIMDDLLENTSNCSSEHIADSESKGRREIVTPVKHRNSANHEKIKVTESHRRRSARSGVQIDGQAEIVANGFLTSVGVITRSMRRKNNLSEKSSMKRKRF